MGNKIELTVMLVPFVKCLSTCFSQDSIFLSSPINVCHVKNFLKGNVSVCNFIVSWNHFFAYFGSDKIRS